MLDAVGVGIGPFNLSVAALLRPVPKLEARFFDREPEFQWHPGLLFPEATIQVSFLKDLVTLADPTSPYSFLSFLFATRRLYRFITAEFPRVTRREFNQYLRWVCDSLPFLEFDRSVAAIRYEGDRLLADLDDDVLPTRNVIAATGLVPHVPVCARPHLGRSLFHASEYLRRDVQPKGRRIAVVGGGQTGAEIVFHLLSRSDALPVELSWVSRRLNFLPLDDSPFTNELFTPRYNDFFSKLPRPTREKLVDEQKLASDGISTDLLASLYRRLYELEFLERWGRCSLRPGTELVDIGAGPDGFRLRVHDRVGECESTIGADLVVLCTGFEYRMPPYFEPLADRIAWGSHGFVMRDDFSIEWDGPPSLNIYVQNAARYTRGIADPNLSLMAWRSARIVNSLAGDHIYDVGESSTVFEWTQGDPGGELREAL